MGNMSIDTFKIGALDGVAAIATLVILIIAALLVLAVIIINAVKVMKESKDKKEDAEENKFFEEYGVTGEELLLNHKLATMREELRLKHPPKSAQKKQAELKVEEVKEPVKEENKKDDEKPAEPTNPAAEPVKPAEPIKAVEQKPAEEKKPEPPRVQEPIKAAPIKEEPPKAQEPANVAPIAPAKPVEDKKPEPVKPVEDKKPEPPKPVEAPKPVENKVEQPKAKESAEAPKPAVQAPQPVKQGVVPPQAAKKVAPKKPDDWAKYEGDFDGYYYDPEDGCYYEGEPTPEIAEKLAKKRAEIEAENAKTGKKVVIKKIAPPFVALKTPKNIRQKPKKVITDGLDKAEIYGQYVIEHKNLPDGSKEYWYTLYGTDGKVVYESSNYSASEYVYRAIMRLQSHALIGQYTISFQNGKYYFVLKRKTYIHRGMPQASVDMANKNKEEFIKFVHTEVVREQ